MLGENEYVEDVASSNCQVHFRLMLMLIGSPLDTDRTASVFCIILNVKAMEKLNEKTVALLEFGYLFLK